MIATVWTDGSLYSYMKGRDYSFSAPFKRLPVETPGGYGFIVQVGQQQFKRSGSFKLLTNKASSIYAELRAVLEALRFLESHQVTGLEHVHVYTDNLSVLLCITQTQGTTKNALSRHEYWKEAKEILKRLGAEIWGRSAYEGSDPNIMECHKMALAAMRAAT